MTSHDNLRMLAAIMFTDIVGYTRMMGDDEEHARQVRDRYRSTLQNAITAGTGRILQYYGDGTLSIFGSAIDAVHAAIEIQRAFRIKPHLPVRIGIHLGDIVYEDDAIFGNGVNVTSRIQALAAPGSILVSDKIADELKNQPGLDTLSYGKVELKNVDRPIELFAIVSDGIVLPKKDQIYSKLPVSYKSIAVLPFVNLSTDPENEYFSDGITEEILNSLTRVEGLQVTSRTSSFMFKNRNEDAREIGALLNVSTLLEGSVRKHGNSIRVTAQLIDTVTGFHLWSENFDRELKDVFALQDEIADTIAEKLTHKLSSPRLEPRNTPRYAENFEAYSAYLKALFYWNKWSPDYINRAIPLLEEAIRLEPMFPPAYSLLGSCYVWLGAMGYLEVGLASSEAKYYILQALNQDEHAIEPQIAMAMASFFMDWDIAAAGRWFKKAFSLGNAPAMAHMNYGIYLNALGKYQDGLEEFKKAYQKDPLNVLTASSLGSAFLCVNQLDAAEDMLQKVLEMEPAYPAALKDMGFLHIMRGKLDHALTCFQEINALSSPVMKRPTLIGYVYGLMGRYDKVLEAIKEITDYSQAHPEVLTDIDYAVLYLSMKDYEKSIMYLESAYIARSSTMLFLRHSQWSELRSFHRFQTLLDKIGLA